MKYRHILIFILFVSGITNSLNLHAGEAIVFGKSEEWANKKISFCRYQEFITYSEEIIASAIVSDDGSFEIKIPVSETQYVFAHLEIYKLYLYAEPGNKYELVLPPYQAKTPADLLNPYFEELALQAGIANINENDLNLLIRMFDDAYEPYYEKHVIESVSGKDFSTLDADIQRIDAPFTNSTNKFFRDYMKYKYAYLRYLALQHNVTNISEMFFTNQPVLYHNPAYMELFNQVFDKYFLYHGRTEKGKKIYDNINVEKDYSELLQSLKNNNLFKDNTLLELVVLKNLHDEFYNDKFSRSGIMQVLDSLRNNTSIGKHKMISEIIRTKISRLLSGFPPPAFELYDLDSNLVTLQSFKGKYLYLNFCACSSYSCLKEFELLQGVYSRHKERLEIVTIAVDAYDISLSSFLKKNNYQWKFLYYGREANIMNDYDIRAFPTYFLIGPDGNLIQSPAPGPGENFERKLFEVMRSRGDL